MMDTDLPEPDRVEGAPHPRETPRLIGQEAAEAAFLDAFTGGRMHHGWLLTGPRGVGKATLAWEIARFLLSRPAAPEVTELLRDIPPPLDRLDIAPEHPVARRLAALSDPGLFLLRRAWDDEKKRLKTVITVDEVRKLHVFFNLSAIEGGRRVVIVDAVDEMNPNAANALLKLLEEPPARATLLLISHQPARLLPTIRSRCRELRLGALAPRAMAQALEQAGHAPGAGAAALTELSGGSVGEAVRLIQLDGLALYSELVGLMAGLPRMDRPRVIALAQSVTGKGGAGKGGGEARLDLALRLIELLLARLARTGATGQPPTEAAEGEAAMLSRLSPGPHAALGWAQAAQELTARARQGKAVNLDPASLILDTVLRIDEIAGRLAA
ncbi:DNA polymerase-3 subunit delta' [Rhodovulum bhavnagarense]|uniref:DNA polymerase-3 subunit delta n=1 Tax=Rhodovulum bhavnagarense TaxID=992286 RepID=A0A4R2RT96_9RHOB|nr:DNA polymerase III subunit delta' [Rhodovulum bhavnagarense]TCP62355.1 DNA polymerase-3 subunit delta' [Rhodovulum bhavnagarense]